MRAMRRPKRAGAGRCERCGGRSERCAAEASNTAGARRASAVLVLFDLRRWEHEDRRRAAPLRQVVARRASAHPATKRLAAPLRGVRRSSRGAAATARAWRSPAKRSAATAAARRGSSASTAATSTSRRATGAPSAARLGGQLPHPRDHGPTAVTGRRARASTAAALVCLACCVKRDFDALVERLGTWTRRRRRGIIVVGPAEGDQQAAHASAARWARSSACRGREQEEEPQASRRRVDAPSGTGTPTRRRSPPRSWRLVELH